VGIMTLLRRGIKIETVAVRIDALYMFLISLLPMVLVLIDGNLNKMDGFILIGAFFLYVVKVFSQRGRFHEETFDKKPHKSEMLKYSVMAVLAILTLILSAGSLVRYASNMSTELVSPSILVGLFLVSIGTTLPELIFGSGAILMKHKYMAFGDIIGSVVANTTLVLGMVALISPAPLVPDLLLFLTSNFFMIVVAFLFATFVDVEKHILWQEGVALIMLYILFVIVILNIRVLEMNGIAG
jgi:cation:H+ antiporter